MTKKGKTSLPVIGWFEYIDLPGLGIKGIKVNVDSGALIFFVNSPVFAQKHPGFQK